MSNGSTNGIAAITTSAATSIDAAVRDECAAWNTRCGTAQKRFDVNAT
ncbi:hypothetical protein [Saccharopolyspora sp. ASAGF58]|nr:hypothetical protein [Saccharopolyspora sp. ASAGF58]